MATNKRSTPSHLELSDEIRVGGAAPLTDRVNVEPAILNGMTTTEAQIIGAISFAFCVAIGGLLVAMFGKWQILLIVSLFCPLVILWFASKKLAQVKRNRPDGYYAQAIPACFYRLGTMNKAKGIIAGVHTPVFNIDESAIETGMGMMAWLGSTIV